MQAGLYRHYKGGIYLCLGVGEHSETGERLVVYVSLDATRPGLRMRLRPVDGSNGWMNRIAWPDGVTRQRFVYIGDEIESGDAVLLTSVVP
jgi:hypothetical protein